MGFRHRSTHETHRRCAAACPEGNGACREGIGYGSAKKSISYHFRHHMECGPSPTDLAYEHPSPSRTGEPRWFPGYAIARGSAEQGGSHRIPLETGKIVRSRIGEEHPACRE